MLVDLQLTDARIGMVFPTCCAFHRIQQCADHLKLMLPFTVALTNLAWGASEGKAMIEAAGHTAIVNDVLDLFADFLMRCHLGPGEFVAAVRRPNCLI